MRSLLQLGLLGALFASKARAVGAAEFINACPFNVWYQVSDNVNFPTTINLIEANDGFYTENFDTTSGRSIQLSTSTTDFNGGGPVLAFEYTVSGGTIFYDLSTVQGNPFGFDGNTVLLATTRDNCPTSDVSSSSQAGNGFGIVRTCTTDINLFLTLCNTESTYRCDGPSRASGTKERKGKRKAASNGV